MSDLAETIEVELRASGKWLTVDQVTQLVHARRSNVDKMLRRLWERGTLFRRRDCSGYGLILRYAAAVDYETVKDLSIGPRTDTERVQLIVLARRLLAALEAVVL